MKPLFLSYKEMAALGFMLLGILLTTSDFFEQEVELASGVVASVNGEPIETWQYSELLSKLAQASGYDSGYSEHQKKQILDLLIEEYALAQHAIEQGLIHKEPRLRKALASAVGQWLDAETPVATPTVAQLERYYQDNLPQFHRSEQFRFDHYVLRCNNICSELQLASANQKLTQLLINKRDVLAEFKSDSLLLAQELNRQASSKKELHHKYGAKLSEMVTAMAVGEISSLLQGNGQYQVFRLIDKVVEPVKNFEQVREQVTQRWYEQQQRLAYRKLIDEIRRSAEVEVSEQEITLAIQRAQPQG